MHLCFENYYSRPQVRKGDKGVVVGLFEKVDTEDASDHDEPDETSVVRWAFRRSNEVLAQWIHEQIIVEEDDGICSAKNYPKIDRSASNPIPVGQTKSADRTCVLAVYCAIARENNKGG